MMYLLGGAAGNVLCSLCDITKVLSAFLVHLLTIPIAVLRTKDVKVTSSMLTVARDVMIAYIQLHRIF